ncbi:MAG: hypothetical protein K0S38_525 [Candidatus Paceibacter sp.]|nr:hypothetical protein [Candidatus Paceibacter sp.]
MNFLGFRSEGVDFQKFRLGRDGYTFAKMSRAMNKLMGRYNNRGMSPDSIFQICLSLEEHTVAQRHYFKCLCTKMKVFWRISCTTKSWNFDAAFFVDTKNEMNTIERLPIIRPTEILMCSSNNTLR